MIDKLSQIQKSIVAALKNISWDENWQEFKDQSGYNEELNTISVNISGTFSSYTFAQYIYSFPRDIKEEKKGPQDREQEEEETQLAPLYDKYFRLLSKLVYRNHDPLIQLNVLNDFESRIRTFTKDNLHPPIKYERDKWDLIFEILDEDFDKRFFYIKRYDAMVTYLKQDAVLNDYQVFKWNGTQADLFRYVNLAIDLKLIGESRSEIAKFLSKHVACRNKTTGEFTQIRTAELKNTFYNKKRIVTKPGFIEKLISNIRKLNPE
jgi:hypothetical protein